jgi:tryptophanyl-tRNA synthetase
MYTDPNRIHANVPGTVEGNPVFTYHDIFNNDSTEVEDLKNRYREGTVGDVEVKDKLIFAINNFLEPMRIRRAQFEEYRGLVEQIIYDGTNAMNDIANDTLKEVKSAMGLSGAWKRISRMARDRMESNKL